MPSNWLPGKLPLAPGRRRLPWPCLPGEGYSANTERADTAQRRAGSWSTDHRTDVDEIAGTVSCGADREDASVSHDVDVPAVRCDGEGSRRELEVRDSDHWQNGPAGNPDRDDAAGCQHIDRLAVRGECDVVGQSIPVRKVDGRPGLVSRGVDGRDRASAHHVGGPSAR